LDQPQQECSFEQPAFVLQAKPQNNTAIEEELYKRGPCAGRGGKCGRGPVFTKEEREVFKKTRIATRISLLESKLADPTLSSDRERVISWKLSKLREKLETIALEKSEIENSETERPWRRHGPHHVHPHGPCHPHFDEVETETSGRPHGPRGCGGRGRGCGRGRWAAAREAAVAASCAQEKVEKDGEHILGKKWVVPKQTWIQFQEAKENLRVARRSGDAEAIKKAFEAFVVVKQQKKENRFPKVVQ